MSYNIPVYVKNSFYYPGALEINKARINHLAKLKLNFKDKKILETGCGGIGDITKFLYDEKAIITLNDYRKENIDALLSNTNLTLKYNTWDLNEIINNNNNKKFDIIVCYGTLYHLTKLENAFLNLANLCNEYVIISTCTSGKNDEEINIVDEGNSNEQSSNGKGSRPGRLLIWNLLKKNFKYTYCIKSQPNNSDYPLSFPSDHSSSRNIFIGSHVKINNENLVENLINSYTL